MMKYLFLILCLPVVSACSIKKGERPVSSRTVTDALCREVVLPDSVRHIVCIRASALRLVTYAGGVPFICGVEEQEIRNNDFTHLVAYPGLKQKKVIGPPMGGDPELILSARPDVIFMSTTTAGDADLLQRHTGIPVVTLEYGDLGDNRSLFYRSLRLIGEVLGTGSRVDTLIRYIDRQIAELQQRTAAADKKKRVYVGGISYRGLQGITSTDPYYAAFRFIGACNVAATIDPAYTSPIAGTFIDWEQLADWDPEVIFVDAGGLPLVREDFRKREALHRLLSAYRNKQVYTLWPYNNHHTNFEAMLINAWSAGKVLFPEQFADIRIEEKADEILTRFVGAPIAGELTARWGKFRNIFAENDDAPIPFRRKTAAPDR